VTFTDITIVPVPTSNKQPYLEFSKRIAEIYREHGALRVVDCWQADDASDDTDFHAADAMVNYPPGSLPNFRKLAGAGDGETVVVTFVEWPSRKARDHGVKAATTDPRVQPVPGEEPVFDGSLLIAGGFTVELDVR
jgi:uncharacterized protein YbaA (DUF1428 family)